MVCHEPGEEIFSQLRVVCLTRAASRRLRKQPLAETAKFHSLVAHRAAARRPSGAAWPALGRARISPRANRATGHLPKEQECPPVRSPPFVLVQAFPRPLAIPVRPDFYLSMTATARLPPRARPLDLVHLPGQVQRKDPPGRGRPQHI